MVIRIAINGFGRNARLIFRALRCLYPKESQVVAIHDNNDIQTNAYLLKYDSIYGSFPETINIDCENNIIKIGEGESAWKVANIMGEVHPNKLPWDIHQVDVVVETQIKYSDSNQEKNYDYHGHFIAGAKKVLLVFNHNSFHENTIIKGINDLYLNAEMTCFTVGSDLMNCVCPMLQTINQSFGILSCCITSVHSLTEDQVVTDKKHPDLRCARASGINTIPTSQCDLSQILQIMPDLNDVAIQGLSIKVPTLSGTLVSFNINVNQIVTKDDVNHLILKSSKHIQKNVITMVSDPIVSSDILFNSHSCIVDSLQTSVIHNYTTNTSLIRIVSWFDSEWMISCRCADLLILLKRTME